LVEGEEDAPVPLDTLREAQKDANKAAHKEVNTEGQANDLDPPPTSQPSEEQEQGQRQDDQSNHPSYSILSATFLGDSPLLAVSCSDGAVRVWTSWPLLGPKRACVLTFENAEPPHGYTFDGEEDELCPLLHRIGTGGPPRLPSRPAAVKPKRDEHGLPVKPKAIIIPEDPHLRDWKVMPRLDSPRRRVAVPAPCLVWDPCGGHCLLTGDESGRIRRWDVSDLFLRLEQARLLVREANGWRTAAMAAEEEHSLLQQLEVHFEV
jgi:WD40 repeat protein